MCDYIIILGWTKVTLDQIIISAQFYFRKTKCDSLSLGEYIFKVYSFIIAWNVFAITWALQAIVLPEKLLSIMH